MAKNMKKRFEDSIDLNIYTNDSEEAKEVEIRGSTHEKRIWIKLCVDYRC